MRSLNSRIFSTHSHTHKDPYCYLYTQSHIYLTHIHRHKYTQILPENNRKIMQLDGYFHLCHFQMSLPLSQLQWCYCTLTNINVPLIENSQRFRKSVHTQLHFIYAGKKGRWGFIDPFISVLFPGEKEYQFKAVVSFICK